MKIKSKKVLPVMLLLLLFGTLLTVAEEEENQIEPGDEFTIDHLEYELLSENEASLLGWESDGEESRQFTIPDTVTYGDASYTVTEIAELAFAGSETIETVIIGSNIRTIGDYAFSECEALHTIQIPAQVETIGQGAFSGDENIIIDVQKGNTSYSYENGLLMKGDSILFADPAMEECSIPANIKTIQPYAFQGCDYLNEIRIPATVSILQENAFAECYGIERIHIENTSSLKLEKDAFGQMNEEGTIYVDTQSQKQQIEAQSEAYPDGVKVVCSQSYQITYETNGGIFLAAPLQEGNSSEDIELPEPSREGYQFEGWCVDKACEQEPRYMIMAGNTENVTCYAKWEEEEEGTEEPEDIDDTDDKEVEKASEKLMTELVFDNRKNNTKTEKPATTEDSRKEADTRQELSTEEQAEEEETPEQTAAMDKTTEAQTVTLPDNESNSTEEVKKGKQTQTDNPASYRRWWVYALLGSGVVCIITGITLLLSAKRRKEPEHKDKKSHKPTALLLLLLTGLTALSQSQPSAAANTITSTKLVIRDDEKAYRENIGVDIGSTLTTCYVVFTPENTTNQNVTFTTSNPRIATVTARKSGTTTYADITGLTEGVTTLTATAADGGSTYNCLVTVRTPIEEAEGELAESMKLKKSALDNASNFETTCQKGQRGRIKGSVGNYYYFDCPAGILEKNYHVAYVPKNKVTIYANSISLNKNSITLNKGKKERLTATISPSVTTNQTVTYQSSNESIATVTAKGQVKAKGRGEATITATTKSRYMGQDITRTATCQVTVTQPVKKLLLKPAKITLEKGRSKKINIQIRPTNANDKTIEWSTSNADVAEVDSSGKVTAKAEGTATITARNPASGKKKRCKVTVLDTELYELVGEEEMEVGKTYTFQVVKKGTMEKQAKKAEVSSNGIYSSSNPKVAKVDKHTGKVTPLKQGTVTITCRQKNTHIVLKQKTLSFFLTKAENERLNNVQRFMILEKGVDRYRYIIGSTSEARKDLTFSSTHSDIASVGLDGKVTGYKEGTCKIKTKLKYKTVTTDVYVYQSNTEYGMIDQQAKLYYEDEKKKNSVTLKSCDRVDVLGKIGDSYYYVNQLDQAGNIVRTGIVKQKQVLLYSEKEIRDYVTKMRKGSWKYMYYSNTEERIQSDHSPIQMVLVGNTVHIYVKFCYKGPSVNEKFTYTNENGKKKKSKLTYKEVFEQGIQKYWGNKGYHPFVGGEHRYQDSNSGNEYTEKDFEKGVTLRCEVHFIHNLLRDDNQIPVYIGRKKKDNDGDYWFWVHNGMADTKKKENGVTYYYTRYHFNDIMRYVNIPTNPQLSSNKTEGGSGEHTLTEYQKSCAHEFGHVLGLDDAYEDTVVVGDKKEYLVRIDDLFFKNYYHRKCIMKNSWDVESSVTANELEMILLAYNNAQNRKQKLYSWQSYRNYQYQIKDKTYKEFLRSKAITMEGEMVK